MTDIEKKSIVYLKEGTREALNADAERFRR